MAQSDEHVLFRETQRFSQARLGGLMVWGAAAAVVVCVCVIVSTSAGGREGLTLVAVIGGLAAVLVPAGVVLLVRLFEMTTEVRGSGLYVRMYPFHSSFRRIDLSDLSEIRVRRYRPIAEYGGWGIRTGWKGSAYNVSGDLGVDLIFAHRRPLLIGSQKPRTLAEALGAIWSGPRVDLIGKQ